MTPLRLSLGSLALVALGLIIGRLFLHRTLAAQSQMYDNTITNYQEHSPADLEEASAQAELETLRQRRAAASTAIGISATDPSILR